MKRIHLFGVQIDSVRLSEAVARTLHMAKESGPCRFVVTPNLDHSIQLQENAALRAAYVDAALVIADGWPVVVAARLLGRSLPERVTGSDLVPRLFAAASPADPLRVFLLGAAPGVADRARARVEAEYPGVRIVGTYSPPLGFERDAAENDKIIAMIGEKKPEVLIVGLGAPKQELWVHRHRERLTANVALCVGATIDFLAGERPRAPSWVQFLGLEWAHRLASEPRRLGPRYAKNAVGFPKLIWDQWRRDRDEPV